MTATAEFRPSSATPPNLLSTIRTCSTATLWSSQNLEETETIGWPRLQQQSKKKRGLLSGILLGGAISGVLDLLAAFVSTRLQSGFGRSVVLKAIASGLLGTHAFSRSTGTAFLGLVLHFFIAFLWAAFIAVAITRWEFVTGSAECSTALCFIS